MFDSPKVKVLFTMDFAISGLLVRHRMPTTPLRFAMVSGDQLKLASQAWAKKFLGFSFTSAGIPKRRIAPQAVERFKERVRELTRRAKGVSIERMSEELAAYLRGWLGYFGKFETPSCWHVLNSGRGVGCGRRSGNSGSEERCVLPSYDDAEQFRTCAPGSDRAQRRSGWRDGPE